MNSETKEEANQCRQEICIPQEVRIKYFPQTTTMSGYDVLPLFEVEEYKQKMMHETSFLENPCYAAKWKEFNEGLPYTAKLIKPVSLSSKKIEIFANYRKQKVPFDYYSAFVGPSSPHAIFWKME